MPVLLHRGVLNAYHSPVIYNESELDLGEIKFISRELINVFARNTYVTCSAASKFETLWLSDRGSAWFLMTT